MLPLVYDWLATPVLPIVIAHESSGNFSLFPVNVSKLAFSYANAQGRTGVPLSAVDKLCPRSRFVARAGNR